MSPVIEVRTYRARPGKRTGLLEEYRAVVVEDIVGLWDAWPGAAS